VVSKHLPLLCLYSRLRKQAKACAFALSDCLCSRYLSARHLPSARMPQGKREFVAVLCRRRPSSFGQLHWHRNLVARSLHPFRRSGIRPCWKPIDASKAHGWTSQYLLLEARACKLRRLRTVALAFDVLAWAPGYANEMLGISHLRLSERPPQHASSC
jgi:hypothetical protein